MCTSLSSSVLRTKPSLSFAKRRSFRSFSEDERSGWRFRPRGRVSRQHASTRQDRSLFFEPVTRVRANQAPSRRTERRRRRHLSGRSATQSRLRARTMDLMNFLLLCVMENRDRDNSSYKYSGKKAVVIGASMAGVIAAAYLAKQGFTVKVGQPHLQCTCPFLSDLGLRGTRRTQRKGLFSQKCPHSPYITGCCRYGERCRSSSAIRWLQKWSAQFERSMNRVLDRGQNQLVVRWCFFCGREAGVSKTSQKPFFLFVCRRSESIRKDL